MTAPDSSIPLANSRSSFGRWLDILIMATLGTSVTAFFFYPGYLDGDSTWQYEQAVKGVFNDKDPAIMAWVWSYLNRVIEGSGGLFLLTTLCFWTGLSLIVRNFFRDRRRFFVITCLVGFFVPNFAMLSQIQKDVGMVATLLLGYGALLVADRSRSPAALGIAFVSICYALSVRHNSLLAVPPLVLWMGFLVARDHLPDRLGQYCRSVAGKSGVGVLLFGLMIATSNLSNSLILGDYPPRYKIWLYETLFSYDLVGIAVRSGKNYIPRGHFYPARPMEIAELRELYHPQTLLYLYWGGPQERYGRGPKERRLPIIADQAMLDALKGAWAEAVVSEPRAYLAHRRDLFLGHLGILAASPYRTVQFIVWVNYQGRKVFLYPYKGPTVFETAQNKWLTGQIADIARGILFRPWPYLTMSVIVLILAWRQRHAHLLHIALLGASSFLYTLPYAVIGVSAEFRYLWWAVLVAIIQLLIFFSGLPWNSRAEMQIEAAARSSR
jgi:hypothetical protein